MDDMTLAEIGDALAGLSALLQDAIGGAIELDAGMLLVMRAAVDRCEASVKRLNDLE